MYSRIALRRREPFTRNQEQKTHAHPLTRSHYFYVGTGDFRYGTGELSIKRHATHTLQKEHVYLFLTCHYWGLSAVPALLCNIMISLIVSPHTSNIAGGRVRPHTHTHTQSTPLRRYCILGEHSSNVDKATRCAFRPYP